MLLASTAAIHAANTTYDFETIANGASSFSSSSQTWTLTGNMHGVVASGFGAPAADTASPTTNRYIDTTISTPRSGNVGGITAPAGQIFRAVSFDVWPSSSGGSTVYGGTDNTLGTVGLFYTVIGKKNGSQVVSANVTDTARTPPQTGTAVGGYWHHLDLSSTAFATTDIDTIEFVLAEQTGAAMNYLAVDNFIYSNFGPADTTSPTVTSIVRQTPSTQATNSTSATFRVTFSEAVNTPATTNFAVAPVGSGTVAGTVNSVSSVSGSTSIYDVAVTITSGTGEFRLKVVD